MYIFHINKKKLIKIYLLTIFALRNSFYLLYNYIIMTLQQLEYIVALNRHRHFVKAAQECNVAQPTLSAMIKKLEDELEVTIFDRAKHPIEPTLIGERIIIQAQRTLEEMGKIDEMVHSEVATISGTLRIGIIPTVAPYLIPDFISKFKQEYPSVELAISEMRTAMIVEQLKYSLLDMAIVSTPLDNSELLEIPIFYERFVAYFSPLDSHLYNKLKASDMPTEHLWVLQEGHCARNQIFNFCNASTTYNHTYEAGSIETLIKIVDTNGGYTVIPELHIPFLSKKQAHNIREISSPPATREISIIIRKDYIKERMINAVVDTVKAIIPDHMLDQRLKKFAIRLL